MDDVQPDDLNPGANPAPNQSSAPASDLGQIRTNVAAAINASADAIIGRRSLAELVFLCLVAQENLLLIGPPGTGKSAAARLAARNVGGRYFEYLIGRFTEPSEIFGPLDLEALQRGQMRPDVTGMLPEAEIAFLDEIFLGSTAILNTLLGILNERRYRRGAVDLACPLRCCVAAANHLPDDPMLRAFADRFLATVFVDPVGDHGLESLLEAGWRYGQRPEDAPPSLTIADLDKLTDAAKAVDMAAVRPLYAHVLRKLRGRGIRFSDRRIVKCQSLIASAAAVAGRAAAEPGDLWPIVYMAQDREAQATVRDILQDELKSSANPVFSDAAREASVGAAARAEELRGYGAALLDQRPQLETGEAWEVWLVKVESLLAQIDAGFAKDEIPEALAALQTALSAISARPAGDTPPAGPEGPETGEAGPENNGGNGG